MVQNKRNYAVHGMCMADRYGGSKHHTYFFIKKHEGG